MEIKEPGITRKDVLILDDDDSVRKTYASLPGAARVSAGR